MLTRFNERYPEIDNELCLDTKWLQTKVETFKKVTIPSIEAQTDQDFFWIVKFHKNTPSWVRNELKHPKIISDFSFSVEIETEIRERKMFDSLYFIKHSPCNLVICKWYFAKKIESTISPKTNYIITTSLDSDDALSLDHIEIVKKEIQPKCFFDFDIGIARVLENESKFIKYQITKNVSPFYSFCEPICKQKRIKTVYHIPHHYVGNKCIRINQTGWLQTYDDTNLINRAKDISNTMLLTPEDTKKFPYVCF